MTKFQDELITAIEDYKEAAVELQYQQDMRDTIDHPYYNDKVTRVESEMRSRLHVLELLVDRCVDGDNPNALISALEWHQLR